MSTVKEHANQSTNRLILILFCTIQFVAFLGLTVYETKHRQDLQANLELKRAAIRNISSTCLRIDLLKVSCDINLFINR